MRAAPAVCILCVAAALVLIPLASPTSYAPPLSRHGAFQFCHTCLASPPAHAGNDRSSLSRLDVRLRGGSGAPEEGQPSADHDADTSEGEMAEVEASPTEGEVPDNAPASCPGTASDQAGKTDGCAGCPNQKACSSGEGAPVDPDAEAIAERMDGIKYKVPTEHLIPAAMPDKGCVCLALHLFLSHCAVLRRCGTHAPRARRFWS